jgi:transposase-like protein
MSNTIVGLEMQELVSQYKSSGQSQMEFSLAHNISKSKLHYWIKKLETIGKVSTVVSAATFVPIAITPTASQKTDQAIVIRLTSGIEIEIPI